MVKYRELPFGFEYGAAKVERLISSERPGHGSGVVLGVDTGKHRVQLYVTSTGQVRIWIDGEGLVVGPDGEGARFT